MTHFSRGQAELYVAEALANAGWTREEATCEEIRESLSAQCRGLGTACPELSSSDAERIRSALRELSSRWRTLLPKGSLSVTFPDPEANR